MAKEGKKREQQFIQEAPFPLTRGERQTRGYIARLIKKYWKVNEIPTNGIFLSVGPGDSGAIEVAALVSLFPQMTYIGIDPSERITQQEEYVQRISGLQASQAGFVRDDIVSFLTSDNSAFVHDLDGILARNIEPGIVQDHPEVIKMLVEKLKVGRGVLITTFSGLPQELEPIRTAIQALEEQGILENVADKNTPQHAKHSAGLHEYHVFAFRRLT